MAVFQAMDADGSDSVDYYEFRASFHKLMAQADEIAALHRNGPPKVDGPPLDPEQSAQCRALFKMIDTSKDGQLSKAELYKAMKENRQVREMMGVPEGLEPDELKERFEPIFNSMDSDNSNKIDYAEFASAFHRLTDEAEAIQKQQNRGRRGRRRRRRRLGRSQAERRQRRRRRVGGTRRRPPRGEAVVADQAGAAGGGGGALPPNLPNDGQEWRRQADPGGGGARVPRERGGARAPRAAEGHPQGRRLGRPLRRGARDVPRHERRRDAPPRHLPSHAPTPRASACSLNPITPTSPPPQVFQSIDVDNSKTIDEDEFKAAFHRLTAEADSMVRAHQMKNKLRGVFAANVFKAGLGKDKLPESFKKPPTIECCREQAGSRGSKQLVLKWWRGDAESWVVQWTCTSWKAPLEIICGEPVCRMSANAHPEMRARVAVRNHDGRIGVFSNWKKPDYDWGHGEGAKQAAYRPAGSTGAPPAVAAHVLGGQVVRASGGGARPSTAPSSTSVGATRYYSGGASAWLSKRDAERSRPTVVREGWTAGGGAGDDYIPKPIDAGGYLRAPQVTSCALEDGRMVLRWAPDTDLDRQVWTSEWTTPAWHTPITKVHVHDNYSAIKLEQSSFGHATDQVRARVAAKQDGYIGAWSDWFNVATDAAARDGGRGGDEIAPRTDDESMDRV